VPNLINWKVKYFGFCNQNFLSNILLIYYFESGWRGKLGITIERFQMKTPILRRFQKINLIKVTN
jgi:hypothetical protein